MPVTWLRVLFMNMLWNTDRESGRWKKHGGSRRVCICDLISARIHKTMRNKEIICLLKIINIHSYRCQILWNLFWTCNVYAISVSILHVVVCVFATLDTGFYMAFSWSGYYPKPLRLVITKMDGSPFWCTPFGRQIPYGRYYSNTIVTFFLSFPPFGSDESTVPEPPCLPPKTSHYCSLEPGKTSAIAV